MVKSAFKAPNENGQDKKGENRYSDNPELEEESIRPAMCLPHEFDTSKEARGLIVWLREMAVVDIKTLCTWEAVEETPIAASQAGCHIVKERMTTPIVNILEQVLAGLIVCDTMDTKRVGKMYSLTQSESFMDPIKRRTKRSRALVIL